MKRSNYLMGAALLLCAASAMAQTTRPSAVPQVTVGAGVKTLIFDWDPVPGATYYQLHMNQDGHSGFSPTGGRIAAPATRTLSSVSVHLQHWQDALYKVSACNAAGCRDSKALFPRRHMLETVGYFKASNSDPHDGFGSEVVVSGDGNTLAVVANNEASNATGINGDQSNNSLHESGAVYLFRKLGSRWRQTAYLKAPDNGDYRHFGVAPFPGSHAVGLSNDGSLLVVGAADAVDSQNSRLFTYVRSSSGTWSLNSSLQAPDPQDGDGFGSTVDLSTDGTILRVEASGVFEKEGRAGVSYLFTRSASGAWQFQQSIGQFSGGELCPFMRMSGDGTTLVQLCSIDGERDAHLATYRRSGSTWSVADDFDLGTTLPQAPALSFDAQRLALRVPLADGHRSVRVYRRVSGGWAEEGNLHEPVSSAHGPSEWGGAMSFSRNGSLLAVGDMVVNPPGPAGVSEEVAAGDAAYDGNVFIYQRSVVGASVSWNFRSQVLAKNPEQNDAFGCSVSLSATGNTLAVGALAEDSGANSINGGEADNNITDAGAAYLY